MVPKTKQSIESQSSVFLQKNYRDFHKLDISEIAIQLAAITNELIQMYDIDEDVTPVDEDRNNLPHQTNFYNDEK
jgi:hypothetical protein